MRQWVAVRREEAGGNGPGLVEPMARPAQPLAILFEISRHELSEHRRY